MIKRSKRLQNLLERDNYHCGIHYGGCGKKINSTDIANIDHIIPKTILKNKQGHSTFYKPVFLQPMHESCNSIDKRGQLTKYPEFTCDCHYTYFNVETETVEIFFRQHIKHNDTFEWKKEIFIENFIDDSKNGMGIIMMVGNRGDSYGFKKDNDMGSMFRSYKYSEMYICYLMNILSLLKCKRIEEAKQEYIKYTKFVETENNYPRPETLNKVDKLFETLSDTEDTSSLSNEILYILNPKAYYYRIGLHKCQSGHFAEGIKYLHKSIELGTNDHRIYEVYSNLGYAYTSIGNFMEAEKHLFKAVELRPDNKLIKGNLAHLYKTQGMQFLKAKKHQQALEFFIKAKNALPISDLYYNLIAVSYFGMGDIQSAIKYVKDGLQKVPDSELLKQNLQELKEFK